MGSYGDLTNDNIASKLITFGANGLNIFQGVKHMGDNLVKGAKYHLPDWGALHEPSQQHGIVNFFQDGHYGQDWKCIAKP